MMMPLFRVSKKFLRRLKKLTGIAKSCFSSITRARLEERPLIQHECPSDAFDARSPDELIKRLRESRFDWLGDNLRFDTGDAEADASLKRTFTFEAGDKTVGVFGLTVHPDHGGNARSHTPFLDGDYVEHAERVIQALEDQDVPKADLTRGVRGGELVLLQ